MTTATKSRIRHNLLGVLDSAPIDTYMSLAKFVGDNCGGPGNDPFYVSDENLLKRLSDYIGSKLLPFGIGDAGRSGEWAQAVSALRRYIEANPGQRVGQAICNITARNWNKDAVDNHRFARIVDWILDDKNPFIGSPVIYSDENSRANVGILDDTGSINGELRVLYLTSERGYVELSIPPYSPYGYDRSKHIYFVVTDAERLFAKYRNMLANAIENWFLDDTADDAPDRYRAESYRITDTWWYNDPDALVAQIRNGRIAPGSAAANDEQCIGLVPIGKMLFGLIDRIAWDASDGNWLVSSWLIYKISGAWSWTNPWYTELK